MKNNNFADQVVHFILRCNLEQLKELTIMDITEHFGVSKVYLINQFKSEKGITPGKFIVREKMYRVACMMERDHKITVKELCERTGFSTCDYFIRVFKAHFGLPPGQYRDIKLESGKEKRQKKK